jgi:hypothetical protein
MADITFSKPTFVDGTSQVSAATFQPVVDALDAVVKRAWISTTATGGEDGNDGQPPAPKPKTYDGNQGSWVLSQFGSTVQGSIAAGGRWAYMAWSRVIATGAWTDYAAGVVVGGSDILTPSSGIETLILQWRIL